MFENVQCTQYKSHSERAELTQNSSKVIFFRNLTVGFGETNLIVCIST